MRTPRLYVDQPLTEGRECNIDGKPAHYMLNVMRVELGRPLTLFNGDGHNYHSSVCHRSKKQLVVSVHQSEPANNESPLHTQLAIGISKSERMDWAIQKATELGINAIHPIFTERGEVKLKGERLTKKIDHWRQVSISACEQSGRAKIPMIEAPSFAHDFLTRSANCDTLKLVCHFSGTKRLDEYGTPTSVIFFIGPEGGLTDNEITLAQTHGFSPLTLGRRILRTETAPVAVLALAQSLWGDF